MRTRSEDGVFLVEAMIAALIGCVLLLAAYSQVAALYRQGTSNENQILATNMAQQLIDNARNCTFSTLNTYANQGWTTVPLYVVNGTNALYPRPLLRNPNLTYSAASTSQQFNGEVQERLTTVSGSVMRLEVRITWADQKGNGHEYRTQTLISQNGIHN